jgi:hypothetical protein
MTDVTLGLSDREAHDVHQALSVVISLIDEVGTIPEDAPLHGARPRLVTVARRLDHERRHHGAVPNPNVPSDA